MKITLEQLKKLIREAVEETHGGKPYSAEELMIALRDNPNLDLPEEEEELAKSEEGEEEDEDYYDSRPGDFARRRLEEGTIRLIYTNHGILTEERVRELKECGYRMEECGSWDVGGPTGLRSSDRYMGDEPVAKVVIVGPGQEDVLEEGGMASTAGTPSYSSNQGVVELGPQGGIAGSAASANPGGANVPNPMEPRGEPTVVITPSNKLESFNRRAERLLEAWMEEELHGGQGKLDLDDDGKIEASDLAMLRRGLKDKHVGKDRKRG